jgi:hypothetical protein
MILDEKEPLVARREFQLEVMMMMHVAAAAAAAAVTILGGSATPPLLKHCIWKLKSRKQQIKPNHIESDQKTSNNASANLSSPVRKNQMHSPLLVAVSLRQRPLHNISFEPHVPNGGKLLFIKCKLRYQK